MEYIEVSGKTKDEAIIKASMQLGTPSDELEIQVISEGSKGFLGFGSKPVVIRAGKKETVLTETIEEVKNDESEDAKIVAEKEPDIKEESGQTDESEESEEKSDAAEVMKETETAVIQKNRNREHKKREPRKIEIITDSQQIEEIKNRAEEFLSDVFQAMHIEANINSVYSTTDGSLAIDFSGDDMGILIGKRGQTLDSLQYLTGLVINKGKTGYVKVKLDTENYRARRKETLENLARGIASKVRKTRKAVVLEPMNPYERRIIHSTLQSNHYVETVSEGEDPYRHIVVKPKMTGRR